MNLDRRIVLLATWLAIGTPVAGQQTTDWPAFRGVQGKGISGKGIS